MMRVVLAILLPLVTAVGSAALVAAWLAAPASLEFHARLPGPQDRHEEVLPEVDLAGFHVAGQGRPSAIAADWPRFRNANFQAVSTETLPLGESWPAGGPATLWQAAMGEGYAGPAVWAGRVYVLDYDQQLRADVLRCLSLDDGREIWRRGYNLLVKRNHGMSRTTPAVAGGVVVSLGPLGHVLAADAVTGKMLWGADLARDYGAKIPNWYAGQCPLIDGRQVVLAPCGDDLLVALDLHSGEVLWRTPNERGWQMTHSSIMPMEIGGRRMYVYCGSGGAAGVCAEGGGVLWTVDWTVNMANAPSPVIVGDGRVFFTGGYGAGSLMVRVQPSGDGWEASEVFRLAARTFGSEQHTPVLHEGYIYGVREDGELVCLDLDGNVRWTSGRDNRFGRVGRGSYLLADGKIFLTDGDSDLAVVRADPSAFRLLWRGPVLEHGESWGPMAIVAGRLIVRDLVTMKCLDARPAP